jgi:hypothetical protein
MAAVLVEMKERGRERDREMSCLYMLCLLLHHMPGLGVIFMCCNVKGFFSTARIFSYNQKDNLGNTRESISGKKLRKTWGISYSLKFVSVFFFFATREPHFL